MEHAVHLAGRDGLTIQQLRALFSLLGKDRFDRGLAMLREAGVVQESR